MKIFVISLKNSVERRKNISEQLGKLGLDFSFFDAYLGKDFYNNPEYYDDKKAKKHIHRSLKAGEVGCALSHNAIYKTIVKEHIPYALILEDDVVLEDNLVKILDCLNPYIKDSRIITLDRCDVHKKGTEKHLFGDFYITKPRFIREGGMANTSGYIITYEAALAISPINYPAWCPADSWGIYLQNVDFYGIIPTQTVIHQNKKFNSTIQSNGIGIMEEISSEGNEEVSYFTAPQLFKYGLKTYVPVTSHFYRLVRWVYRHTLKNILKKTEK